MPIMCRLTLTFSSENARAANVLASAARKKKYSSGILSIVTLFVISRNNKTDWISRGSLRCETLATISESTRPSARSRKKKDTGIKMVSIDTCIKTSNCCHVVR